MAFNLSRRGFIGLLGIGASAIAAEELIPFNRVWSIPLNVRLANIAEAAIATPSAGNFLTIEMITKEALRVLEKKMRKGSFVFSESMSNGSLSQVCVSIPSEVSLFDKRIDGYSREIIEPAMDSLSREIKSRGLKTFKELKLPRAVDAACRVTSEQSGLSLRMIRAYDIGLDRYVTRFDVAGS